MKKETSDSTSPQQMVTGTGFIPKSAIDRLPSNDTADEAFLWSNRWSTMQVDCAVPCRQEDDEARHVRFSAVWTPAKAVCSQNSESSGFMFQSGWVHCFEEAQDQSDRPNSKSSGGRKGLVRVKDLKDPRAERIWQLLASLVSELELELVLSWSQALALSQSLPLTACRAMTLLTRHLYDRIVDQRCKLIVLCHAVRKMTRHVTWGFPQCGPQQKRFAVKTVKAVDSCFRADGSIVLRRRKTNQIDRTRRVQVVAKAWFCVKDLKGSRAERIWQLLASLVSELELELILSWSQALALSQSLPLTACRAMTLLTRHVSERSQHQYKDHQELKQRVACDVQGRRCGTTCEVLHSLAPSSPKSYKSEGFPPWCILMQLLTARMLQHPVLARPLAKASKR